MYMFWYFGYHVFGHFPPANSLEIHHQRVQFCPPFASTRFSKQDFITTCNGPTLFVNTVDYALTACRSLSGRGSEGIGDRVCSKGFQKKRGEGGASALWGGAQEGATAATGALSPDLQWAITGIKTGFKLAWVGLNHGFRESWVFFPERRGRKTPLVYLEF